MLPDSASVPSAPPASSAGSASSSAHAVPTVPGRPSGAAPADARVRSDVPGVTACRLCSGETLGETDPAPGQLGRLSRLEQDGVARLTLSDCLDRCERGDVLVARPRPGARGSSRPVWFERLAGDRPTAELRRWLEAGGPGAAPVPDLLVEHLLVEDEAGPSDDDAPA